MSDKEKLEKCANLMDNWAAKSVEPNMKELIKAISEAIVKLEQKNNSVRYCFEHLDWDAELCFTIDDALMKLGVSLATLEMILQEMADEKTEKKD